MFTKKIQQLKTELKDKVVILAHHYQRDDVVQHADYIGDSYELAKKATEVNKEWVVFAGVKFMAETVDILTSDDQKVIIAYPAGCYLADFTLAEVTTAWNKITSIIDEKDIIPILYINSYADVKAFVGEKGGTITTSSKADLAIEWALNQGKKIFFLPDQHLGRNIAILRQGIPSEKVVIWDEDLFEESKEYKNSLKDSQIILWPGECIVHSGGFSRNLALKIKKQEPQAKIVVHPEVPHDLAKLADYMGSTTQIAKWVTQQVEEDKGTTFYIATEARLVNRLHNTLSARFPEKNIKISPLSELTVNAVCANMSLTNEREIYLALAGIKKNTIVPPPEIIYIPYEIKEKAKLAINKMIEIAETAK